MIFPLILVAVCVVFLEINRGRLEPKFEPIPISTFSGTAQAWAKMTNHTFIPLKDRELLRKNMDELIAVRGEALSNLQREKLVESSSGILYALGTGDWEVYRRSRITAPMERFAPEYKSQALRRALKIPESETNLTVIELHQKFLEQFKDEPFLNSGLLLSSNAFGFSVATKAGQIPYWDDMPYPGDKEVAAYFSECMTDYNYEDYEKEELNKQGKVLWGVVNVVGEGNPTGTIRPYRLEFIWSTDQQVWIPTGFRTAAADVMTAMGQAVKLITY